MDFGGDETIVTSQGKTSHHLIDVGSARIEFAMTAV
jgi:hypothetical protein